MGKEKKKASKKNVNVEEEKLTKNDAKKLVKEKTKEKTKKVEKKKDKKKDKNEKKESIFKRISGFFKGVKSEMSKVVWPSRRNMVKYSIATICFMIFFALYFLGIMSLFNLLKELIIII